MFACFCEYAIRRGKAQTLGQATTTRVGRHYTREKCPAGTPTRVSLAQHLHPAQEVRHPWRPPPAETINYHSAGAMACGKIMKRNQATDSIVAPIPLSVMASHIGLRVS